jgi:RNA polymerase-binding transcription factor
MDEKEITEFREKLLLLKSELQKQEKLTEKAKGPVELDQTRFGRLSRMDAMQAQEMELETTRRRQQQLVKIEGALRRIEALEFGHCFICDDEIDIRRLHVDPTNTRCIGCVGKESD